MERLVKGGSKVLFEPLDGRVDGLGFLGRTTKGAGAGKGAGTETNH